MELHVVFKHRNSVRYGNYYFRNRFFILFIINVFLNIFDEFLRVQEEELRILLCQYLPCFCLILYSTDYLVSRIVKHDCICKSNSLAKFCHLTIQCFFMNLHLRQIVFVFSFNKAKEIISVQKCILYRHHIIEGLFCFQRSTIERNEQQSIQ